MCLIAYRLREQYLSFDSSELTNGTGMEAEVVERGQVGMQKPARRNSNRYDMNYVHT
jgi:hypothetical protein